jgi:hypothetical protein
MSAERRTNGRYLPRNFTQLTSVTFIAGRQCFCKKVLNARSKNGPSGRAIILLVHEHEKERSWLERRRWELSSSGLKNRKNWVQGPTGFQ